jgi:hypothetical protein
MSLGNCIYFLPSLQLNKYSANGLGMAPTPFISLALTASGFGSGSAVTIGALTLGTAKILFGWFTYTYTATSNYTATPGGQNTGSAEPTLLEVVQPEIPILNNRILLILISSSLFLQAIMNLWFLNPRP